MIPKNEFRERIIYQIPNKKLIITNRKIKKRRKVYNLEKIRSHGIVVNTKIRNMAFAVWLISILGLVTQWFIDNNTVVQIDLESIMIAGLNEYIVSFNAKETIILISASFLYLGVILILFHVLRRYSVVIETEKRLLKIGTFSKIKYAVEVKYAIHEAILYMPSHLFNKQETKTKKPAFKPASKRVKGKKRLTNNRKRLIVGKRLKVSY